MSIGFNRSFGWRGRSSAIINYGSPPTNGLIQWLSGGPEFVDSIGAVSAPIVSGGVITQTYPDMALSELWSSDGVTLDAVDSTAQQAYKSGVAYTWVYTGNGTTSEILTYDHVLTEAEYATLSRYLTRSVNDIVELTYDGGGSVIYTDPVWDDNDRWYDLLVWQETIPVYA